MTTRRVPLFVPRRTDGLITLATSCTCRKPVQFQLSEAEYLTWLRDPHADGLSPELVLLLDSGMHPDCIAAANTPPLAIALGETA